MNAQDVFPDHNGFVIDLTGLELVDAVLALLAVVLADKIPNSDPQIINLLQVQNDQRAFSLLQLQRDQQTFSWLMLQLDYPNQPQSIRDILDLTRQPLLLSFERKYTEGFVAHLVFVMFWAIRSNDIKDAGLSKAYHLTETLLKKNMASRSVKKRLKNTINYMNM